MKMCHDKHADAIYITLKGHGVDHTVRIGPDIAIDYGPDVEIHGIEILAAREHLGFQTEHPKIILDHIEAVAA